MATLLMTARALLRSLARPHALASSSAYFLSQSSSTLRHIHASSSCSATSRESSQDPPEKRRRRRTKAEIQAEGFARAEKIAKDSNDGPLVKPQYRKYIKAEVEAERLLEQKRLASSSKTSNSPLDNVDIEFQPGPLLSDSDAIYAMNYAHMPDRSQWKGVYPVGKMINTQYRYFVSNPDTIDKIVRALRINTDGREDIKTTLIEGYPGPGTLTSELIKHPSIEKVIALEQADPYLKSLEKLKLQLEEQGQGSKLDIVKGSAYRWDSYNTMVEEGALSHLQGKVPFTADSTIDFSVNSPIPPDHTDLSWQQESPILYFAQLPNSVHGEQLFAQIIHAIATRLWLFRYGNIRLGFICGESLAKRCVAEAGDRNNRGKLGATVQCLADVRVHLDSNGLLPHHHHFFPSTMAIGPRVPVSSTNSIPNSNASTGLTRTGLCMMTLTPKKKPLLGQRDIEAFEFITRNLFVLRAKTVGEALTHVAPGGQNVLNMMSKTKAVEGLISKEEVIDPETKVVDLTNVQWAALARTFDKWPFRPRHLFEEGRIKTERKDR